MATIMALQRKVYTNDSTIGRLTFDGKFECFTLEDRVRAVKVKGLTAIPEGNYEVVITFSNAFQRRLPLLLNVPNFSGIRIHPGNRPKDTEGCILVGQSTAPDFIGSSKAAFEALEGKLKKALKSGKVIIQVSGGTERDVALSDDLESLTA